MTNNVQLKDALRKVGIFESCIYTYMYIPLLIFFTILDGIIITGYEIPIT